MGLKKEPLGPAYFFLFDFLLYVVLRLIAGIMILSLGTLAGSVDLVVCRLFLIGNILITAVATAVIYTDVLRHAFVYTV